MRGFAVATLTGALCVMLCLNAKADIPRSINYQGKITDLAGTPAADGTYTAEFRIYDVESGGTPLWDETQSVILSGGLYSVLLGGVTPLYLVFDRPYWLEIEMTIAGEVLLARRPLTSAGYAFGVADASISEGKIADGAVTEEKLADGAVGARTIGAGSVDGNHIADGAIGNADISASASIADTKLATIATPGKIAASAVQDKFLRNDADDSTAGVISSAGLRAVGGRPLYVRNDEDDAPSAVFMDGNVGIGTESPGRGLTIHAPDPYLRFERNNDYSWEIGMDCSSGPNCSDFQLRSVSRDETALAVDALTGNVAVGTADAGAAKLRVAGDTAIYGNLAVAGASYIEFDLRDAENDGMYLQTNDGDSFVYFETGQNDGYLKYSDDNDTLGVMNMTLGVGTMSTGTDRLKVAGDASVTGKLAVTGGVTSFGAPVARNANQQYTAATDGFLIGTIRSHARSATDQEIDAFVAINETTYRQQFYLREASSTQQYLPIMCPVRKGEVYEFVTQWETNLVALQWMSR